MASDEDRCYAWAYLSMETHYDSDTLGARGRGRDAAYASHIADGPSKRGDYGPSYGSGRRLWTRGYNYYRWRSDARESSDWESSHVDKLD